MTIIETVTDVESEANSPNVLFTQVNVYELIPSASGVTTDVPVTGLVEPVEKFVPVQESVLVECQERVED